MTVYRRNPLLMTVMGANPGPRRKRPVDDPVDHAIGQAWHRLMSGIQVSIMDIPKIFRDVKLEIAAGMPLEEAVMRVGQRFQVNPHRYRRNPSIAATLAGGFAGALVTQAMSNPGPSFVVIETATGKVVYTKRATGMGNAAIDACFVKANYLSQKTGCAYIVFLDIRGLRVGMQVSVPMVRALGITGEVLPRSNPLTEQEHRSIMAGAGLDMGVAARYAEMGRPFEEGVYRGRAARGREIAHNFSPKSNPRKSSTKKIRRANPQSNPGPRGNRRKITMTIEQFARWVKAKRDPAMWRAFLAKFRGYEKWTHGAKSRKVTLEWQNVPGMDGLWITYDGGKQPESTYIMPSGSPRKGAWKHPWDTMPSIKHDPEAGLVLNKLHGKSKITDFYHR